MGKRIRKKNPDGSYEVRMTVGELCKAMASGKIKQGPIRHPDLPQEVLTISKRIYDWVGKDGCLNTLEQWETNLMRDFNPIRELAVWVAIGLAADRLCCDHSQCVDVVGQLIVASMGGENAVKRVYDEVCREFEGLSYQEIFKRIP